MELINILGCTDWQGIASQMKNRTVRQCRERWVHYLNPLVSHNPWTADEEALLEQKVAEFGTKWTLISKFFHARTDINLKNRWMMMKRHRSKHPSSPADPFQTLFVHLDQMLEKEAGLWNEQMAEWFGYWRPGAVEVG
jgi:hypothetical protein